MSGGGRPWPVRSVAPSPRKAERPHRVGASRPANVGVLVDVLVSARPGRGCTVVEVHGDLDMATSPQFLAGLQRVVDAGERHVVVDLADVGFLDSSALGVLVVTFKTLRDAGGSLSVAAAQPIVRSVLSVTSIDRAISVHDSVGAAEDAAPAGQR